jgi:hypothetical protein
VNPDIREAIYREAISHLGESDSRPFIALAAPVYAPHDRPSWCGIFVRYVWRILGLEIPDWEMGSSNTEYLVKLHFDEVEQGDLVQLKGNLGHQCLFEKWANEERTEFYSIDGNTYCHRTKRSGVVARRKRRTAEVLAFYRAPVETWTPSEYR